MEEFECGQEVEWRSDGWIKAGTISAIDIDWVTVTSPDGSWYVRGSLLRQPGELAMEDGALADLTERAKGYPIGDDEHAQYCRKNRSPWCDTCKRPSVTNEWQGPCHSTAEHPFGVPEHLDDSGHEVTHHEWFRRGQDRARGALAEECGAMRELDIKDEDLPPRVREAEARRRMRELVELSSLGTPGAKALRKIGAWKLHVPGAEEPTAEDYRLADEELEQL